MKPLGLYQLNYFHAIPVFLEKKVNSFIGFITQTHRCIQTHPETQKYRDTHRNTGTDRQTRTHHTEPYIFYSSCPFPIACRFRVKSLGMQEELRQTAFLSRHTLSYGPDEDERDICTEL